MQQVLSLILLLLGWTTLMSQRHGSGVKGIGGRVSHERGSLGLIQPGMTS